TVSPNRRRALSIVSRTRAKPNIVITRGWQRDRVDGGLSDDRRPLGAPALVSSPGRDHGRQNAGTSNFSLAPERAEGAGSPHPDDRRRRVDRRHVPSPARARWIQGDRRDDWGDRLLHTVGLSARPRAARPSAPGPQRFRSSGRAQRTLSESPSGGHPFQLWRAVDDRPRSLTWRDRVPGQV